MGHRKSLLRKILLLKKSKTSGRGSLSSADVPVTVPLGVIDAMRIDNVVISSVPDVLRIQEESGHRQPQSHLSRDSGHGDGESLTTIQVALHEEEGVC